MLTNQASTIAVFETVWKELGERYKASCDKESFDASLYGDLNNEKLMEGRFANKEEFRRFIMWV